MQARAILGWSVSHAQLEAHSGHLLPQRLFFCFEVPVEETYDNQVQEEEMVVHFVAPVEFLEKSMDDGKPPRRMIKGPMSTDREDQDGETIDQAGLDCSYLMTSGYVNYDHQRRLVGGVKVPMIIGYPTALEREDRHTVLESELLQGDPSLSEQMRLAEEMWQLGCALRKAGGARRLAYSVEGPAPERRGKRIIKAKVHHVALTHKPVNADCSVEVFQKALCCGMCSPGHPRYNPAHQCSNKHHDFADGLPHLTFALEKALESTNSGPASVTRTSPLMRENLDRGLTTAIYGDCECDNHFHNETGRFHKGISGCFDHMTKCLGYDTYHSHRLLSRVVKGAREKEDGDLVALCKAAGFIH